MSMREHMRTAPLLWSASACSPLDLSFVAQNSKYMVVCIGKAFFFRSTNPDLHWSISVQHNIK